MSDFICQARATVQVPVHEPWGPMVGLDPIQEYRVLAHELQECFPDAEPRQLDGMIASLKATSDNLKNATAEVRRSPWRLLYKPSGKETANLNIYDAARQFSEGATSLNDAATALRDALNQKDSDPEHIKKLIKEVEESSSRFNGVEKKLWDEVKE